MTELLPEEKETEIQMIIKQLSNLLNKENFGYKETQVNMKDEESLDDYLQRLSSYWFARIGKDPDKLVTLFAELLGAKFVSLDEEYLTVEEFTKVKMWIYRLLRKWKIVSEDRNIRESLISSEIAKATKGLLGDDAQKQKYNIKGGIFGKGDEQFPGYDSYTLGLTPERMVKLLGISLEDIKKEKILIAGIGTGGFLKSLPRGYNQENILGIDISEVMTDYNKKKGITCIQDNISDIKKNEVPSDFKPTLCVLDYVMDLMERPVEAIKNLIEMLPPGGKLMITVLMPVTQVGGKSASGDRTADDTIDEKEKISSGSEDPFQDIRFIQEKLEPLGVTLKTCTIAPYIQYDVGRKDEKMPFEARSTGIMVFEKK